MITIYMTDEDSMFEELYFKGNDEEKSEKMIKQAIEGLRLIGVIEIEHELIMGELAAVYLQEVYGLTCSEVDLD